MTGLGRYGELYIKQRLFRKQRLFSFAVAADIVSIWPPLLAAAIAELKSPCAKPPAGGWELWELNRREGGQAARFVDPGP
jgi:hypothetical protein